MGTAQRIVPTEPAAPPRARSYRSARISRLLAIPASARKWATGAGAQQDSRIDLRAGKRGADECAPRLQLGMSGGNLRLKRCSAAGHGSNDDHCDEKRRDDP